MLRQFIRLVLGLSVALLIACSSPRATPTLTPSPTPTQTPSPVAVPSPSPVSTFAPTPQPSVGSAVLVSPAAPEHLDVHQTATEALLSMGPGIAYSRLMRLKTGSDVPLPSLEVECDLCESWDLTDPLTYVFYLRGGIKWHDIEPVNGRELTADDVVFSLDRLRTPGWPGAALLQSVDSIEALDGLAVRVRLKFPDADFLLSLAHGQSKIVAPEAVQLHGDLKAGPTIGTGPWILDGDAPGEGFTFEANTSYYEPNAPALERFRIFSISGAMTRLAAVLTDNADITVLDEEAWSYLQDQDVKVERGVFRQPGTGVLFGLRADKPPFDVLEVRQALFQSLNPWMALKSVWQGRGEVAVGVPAVSSDWLLSQDEMRLFLNNPDRAAGLLVQAKVDLPIRFSLTVADFGDQYLALGDAYAEMMREAGFEPTMKITNPRVYAENVWSKGDFQVFLGPMPPVYAPNGFLLGMVHSQGRWSITGQADSELNGLIEEQFSAAQNRKDLVRSIQRRLLERALLFMPVSGTSLWVWQERLQDFAPNFAASEYFHWARLKVADAG